MTPYVDFDELGLKRVGCMKCNQTIGTREVNADGTTYLKHWSHLRRVSFTLSDGSFTDVLVCADCEPTATNADLQHFEDTVKFGWRMEKGHITKVILHDVTDVVVVKGTKLKNKDLSKLDAKSKAVPSDEVRAIHLGDHFESLGFAKKGKG